MDVEKISQLMDGEAGDADLERLVASACRDRDALETWHTYDLIGQALRAERSPGPDFTRRVTAALAQEPTVLAPRRRHVLLRVVRQAVPAAAAAAVLVTLAVVALRPHEAQQQVADLSEQQRQQELVAWHGQAVGPTPMERLSAHAELVKTVSAPWDAARQ